MNKKQILLLCALLSTNISFAQTKTEAQEKLEVLTILKKYSETVACETNFERDKAVLKSLKNVHTVERDAEIGVATYFILWDGDMGCNGGSGTHSYIISEVSRFSDNRPFLVQNNNAFGKDFSKSVNSRFISKLQKVNDKRFVVFSSDHKDDDANNFPSEKYQYTLDKVGYEWKVTNKKFLGKNKY